MDIEIINTRYDCEIHGLQSKVLEYQGNYQCLECLETILKEYYANLKWRKKLYGHCEQ